MTTSGRSKTGRIVSRVDLASLCGVSLTTVDTWLRKGCPIVERGSKGREARIDLAAVVDWRIKTAVADAVSGIEGDDGRVSKDEADRRRAVANAISAEVAADEDLKSVMSRFDGEAMMSDFCQALRSALSNVGAKIANRTAAMTRPAEIRDFCQEAVNKAFGAAEADLRERWAGEPDEDGGDSGED